MKKRRALSLLAVMIMVMSTCLTVLADAPTYVKYTEDVSELSTETVNNVDNTVVNAADVTISGIPITAESLSFKTYQVIYATYDSSTNNLVYHLTDWACTALGVSFGSEEEKTAIANIQALYNQTGSTGTVVTEQNDIVNTLAAYITAYPNTSTWESISEGASSWSYTSSNETAIATLPLPVGAYLVVPTAENMAFLNMLVSVDATTSATQTDNKWTITAHGAVLKGNEVGITKVVKETASAETADESTDVQIGKTVTYTITVDVPRFDRSIDNDDIKFEVIDISENITINESTITVTPLKLNTLEMDTALSVYDQTYQIGGYTYKIEDEGTNGKKLTIDFSVNYQSTFYNSTSDTYPYAKVVITYEATLNSTADIAGEANENIATVYYGHDLAVGAEGNKAKDSAQVYTYKVVLTKNGTDGNSSSTLAGAEFKITLDGTTLTFLQDDTDTSKYTVVADGTTGSNITQTLTTGTDGTVTILGLDADKEYIIEETKSPSGYSLNSSVLKFKINATTPGTIDSTGGVTTTEYKDNTSKDDSNKVDTGKETWSATAGSTNNYLELSLTDTKIAAMPSTGSVGIIIFTVLGVCLMIVAVFLMTSSKDKKKQAE